MIDSGWPFAEEVAIYDPIALRAAVDGDPAEDLLGPEDERMRRCDVPRTSEEEVRARHLHRILDDPRGAMRPTLFGDDVMAEDVRVATATMPHFAAVTGIVRRAVLQSAMTAVPIRFPPVLMLSPPGFGKTHYCRAVAAALRTTCVPISINGTSDRGQLGGLSPLWRGAKMGRLARALLVESQTAAPLFLLDEIDKVPNLNQGERTLDVLLSALEPENARSFRDEYVDAPIDLTSALWLASANGLDDIPSPLLDRMLIVEVPRPTQDQARTIAATITAEAAARTTLYGFLPEGVELLVDHAPRQMRRAAEIACGFAAAADRWIVSDDDVRAALALIERPRGRGPIGFLNDRRAPAGGGRDRVA